MLLLLRGSAGPAQPERPTHAVYSKSWSKLILPTINTNNTTGCSRAMFARGLIWRGRVLLTRGPEKWVVVAANLGRRVLHTTVQCYTVCGYSGCFFIDWGRQDIGLTPTLAWQVLALKVCPSPLPPPLTAKGGQSETITFFYVVCFLH